MSCFVIDIAIYINAEDSNFLKLLNFYYLSVGRKKLHSNGFFLLHFDSCTHVSLTFRLNCSLKLQCTCMYNGRVTAIGHIELYI